MWYSFLIYLLYYLIKKMKRLFESYLIESVLSKIKVDSFSNKKKKRKKIFILCHSSIYNLSFPMSRVIDITSK